MPDLGAADRPDRLQASHRRFVLTETLIGLFMSGLVPAVVIALARRPLPIAVFGSGSLATALIPSTLLPSFGVAIVLTFVVRYRVRRGSAPPLGWPLGHASVARLLPTHVLGRAIVSAIAALLIVPPVGLLLLKLGGVTKLTGLQFIAYNFVHGVAQGALVLPAVVTRALADWRG